MSRYLNRRVFLGVVVVLLLAIFVPPLINVNRLRPQIAGALSRALGRPVSVGSVSLRLFPRPGLNLQRLTVQDDPAFSAEPLLQADEVTASLRLTSLWRGRLEMARLSLSYPSLNLVRARNGHWNLESLLERARQTPVAPTAKLQAESRPRFPYVEAEGGRINLKIGQEKKVYALSDADFALWLQREDEWRLRLAARPVRTDANLSDTGRVRLSGSVRRAATLSGTPLDLQLGLERAQLGQLTTLIYGRDRGWRGTVNVNATLRGTPAELKIAGDASVGDFRRYDIGTRGSLRLATRCTAVFSTLAQRLSDIACHSAVGDGAIDLAGALNGVLPPQAYALTLTAHDVPASSLALLVSRMKKNLPEDLAAQGTVAADFDLRRLNAAAAPVWTGSGTASQVELRSALMNEPLTVGNVRFLLGAAPRNNRPGKGQALPETTLHIDSLPLDLGGATPARAQAWFSRTGYKISIEGEAQVRRLLEVALAAGVRAPQPAATGLAGVDLLLAGGWTGFAAPAVSGTAQIRDVNLPLAGFAAPLQIASAYVNLSGAATSVYNLNAGFPALHLSFSGWLRLPVSCDEAQCPVQFQLASNQLSTDELNRLLNPRLQKRPWYDLIGASRPQPPLLGRMSAQGTITAGRVMVGGLTANHVSGSVRLQRGIVSIGNLRAEVLGGTHMGELRADFSGAQPVYSARGALDKVSIALLAALTHDGWGNGRAGGSYQVTASGWDAAALRDSAAGDIAFNWRDGALTHLSLTGGAAPLRLRQFQGKATLAGGLLTLSACKMDTPGGIYTVSGTASLDRQLELRLVRAKAQAYDVSGTLEKPRVKIGKLPPTEAALKR